MKRAASPIVVMRDMTRKLRSVLLVFAFTTLCGRAFAQLAPSVEVSATSTAATAPSPAPYSLPWHLRPVTAGTVLRSDNSIAFYEDSHARSGTTFVSTLLASYKVPGTGASGEGLAPLIRLAMSHDTPPNGTGGTAVVNPLLGASYARKYGNFRANAFLGVTLPIGYGGGDSPSAGAADARSKGIFARASMDNALFAVNDLTVIPGISAAYLRNGFTLQAETTLLQLTRVRGAASQHEASKTNLTCGLHAGYFLLPTLSAGGDVRYQLWLNAPIAIEKQRDTANNNAGIDNLTAAAGFRYHAHIEGIGWFRPGVSYGRGLDKPTAGAANYHLMQVDFPLQF